MYCTIQILGFFLNIFLTTKENILGNFIICQFSPGKDTVYFRHSLGMVYPESRNARGIKIGVKYLCRIVRVVEDRIYFVTVIKSVPDILIDFLPHLCSANWKRGPRVNDSIKTECTVHSKILKAEWYQTTGRYPIKYVTLSYFLENQEIKITIEESDSATEIKLVEKQIKKWPLSNPNCTNTQ